jgi:hypothetical protein
MAGVYYDTICVASFNFTMKHWELLVEKDDLLDLEWLWIICVIYALLCYSEEFMAPAD